MKTIDNQNIYIWQKGAHSPKPIIAERRSMLCLDLIQTFSRRKQLPWNWGSKARDCYSETELGARDCYRDQSLVRETLIVKLKSPYAGY